jgi:hypothetical protein
MGIDIYAAWSGITADEEAAQMASAFSVERGHVGYLREAYHGEPYATRLLVPEAFEKGEADIPAATLRQRLPGVLDAARLREQRVYDETDPVKIERVLDSYRNFVALCERMERETGKPCRITASY